MRNKKYYFKGLLLVGLALLLSACDNTKHTNIIVDSPVGVAGSVFRLITLPTGFIVIGSPSTTPTPISYSISISGDTSNTCEITSMKSSGALLKNQELSGTTHAFSTFTFMSVDNCTAGTEVALNITYQIGTQKYEGSASFTAT